MGALCEDRIHLAEGESSPEIPRDHGPCCLGFSRAATPGLGEKSLADDDMSSGRTSRQARSVAAGDVWAIDRMLILDGRAQRKACAATRASM